MKTLLKMEGLRELDNDLAALPKAVSKPVVRRALAKQLQPVAEMANYLWPGADDSAFAVSSRLKNGQPQPDVGSSAVTMFVGATRSAPHAHLREWGTEPRYHKSGKYVGAVAPTPSLTPSWEAYKGDILQGLAAEIRGELEATLSRRAERGL
ncbi:hypothetical protein K4K94_07885 [Phaeobacter inhibens]|uniref:hypothetical protein n=1 Tax=Phaeobacter inhibens TaxID=221822 RepID=UPI0021A4D03F|nr:hypothetical protein [Phaeobacter inhibens]UWS05631.1 hypothetical protein K4K94_07885 [Phaeobacter inhibens]